MRPRILCRQGMPNWRGAVHLLHGLSGLSARLRLGIEALAILYSSLIKLQRFVGDLGRHRTEICSVEELVLGANSFSRLGLCEDFELPFHKCLDRFEEAETP